MLERLRSQDTRTAAARREIPCNRALCTQRRTSVGNPRIMNRHKLVQDVATLGNARDSHVEYAMRGSS